MIFVESHGRDRRIRPEYADRYIPSHCIHGLLMDYYCKSCSEQWSQFSGEMKHE